MIVTKLGKYRNGSNWFSNPHFWNPFDDNASTLIPARISNYSHHDMWNEITYTVPNFNGYTVEVKEWLSD